ncbi:MAG: Gfo/Idh/MocA family oxidoreductase [Spirochaetaceae bacterium]|nr:MAG: Gfo/Idh/MocA family oxidoreductase [Spirochaetaceae bacterium]
MKSYAIVGIGSRSYLYSDALLGTFRDCGRLAAICDLNQVRMEYANRRFRETYGIDAVPAYKPARFEEMIAECNVDTVIVTTIDRTHHQFIVRALEAGCDVITEKPLTVDEVKCRAIFSALERTGKSLRVTFNYRYAPRNSKVKQLLLEGSVGEVKSVHFEWFLDTIHGADYFRRWHRDKRNSGGLLVHKASHHFDLVNWWLDSAPEQVFAYGDLVFYGRVNAEARGLTAFYDRGTGHPNALGDPFALDLKADPELEEMYLQAESEDGYRRDESVFGHYISIEDDMAVLVKYDNGASMSYHLTAYSPCEGFRIAFNGTKGRLEYEVAEKSYVSGSLKDINQPEHGSSGEKTIEEPVKIVIRPHWGQPESIHVEQSSEGGHGGGDRRLLEDLFRGSEPDPLYRSADHHAGALAILTGIAANRSLASGVPVRIDDLFEL